MKLWFLNLIFIWLFIDFYLIRLEGVVEIRNIECYSLDKSFSDYAYCYLKSVNRTYKYISIRSKLLKIPVTNVTVSVDIRKRTNGYRTSVFNVIVDGCKFLRYKNNLIFRVFYLFLSSHSNMNHTCPYNHDIIVDKLDITFANSVFVKYLPIVDGDYGIFTTWSAYNIPKTCANVFITMKN